MHLAVVLIQHHFAVGGRRSRAAVPEPPDRNPELPRLVGEVLLDAGSGEDHDPDRQYLQHRVVTLEGRGLGVLRPIGLEGDLRHLAMVGPASSDFFGAFRTAAVQQHHVGVLGVDLIEFVPDELVVGAVSTGEDDLRACGQHHLGLGTALGGEEIAAVDQR